MTAYDLVALDMAGTTIDEGGLVYEVVRDCVQATTGAAISDELLRRWKGTSKDGAIYGLLGDLGEDNSPRRVAAIFSDFTKRIEQAYRDTPPTPIPGVLDAFSTLREAGVKIALQTGYGAAIANSILQALGWKVGEQIDALVTSDLVPASRPAPYLVFRCLEATGVTDVRRVLAAGDTPADLGAGTNAGCGFVVGVITGAFGRAALEAESHTHILESAAELPKLL